MRLKTAAVVLTFLLLAFLPSAFSQEMNSPTKDERPTVRADKAPPANFGSSRYTEEENDVLFPADPAAASAHPSGAIDDRTVPAPPLAEGSGDQAVNPIDDKSYVGGIDDHSFQAEPSPSAGIDDLSYTAEPSPSAANPIDDKSYVGGIDDHSFQAEPSPSAGIDDHSYQAAPSPSAIIDDHSYLSGAPIDDKSY
ncbi:MAG TPA: hypothetical protein VL688_00175 [Verrucomicrobiae bacterium]|jgi:hypothetical protein|nr:hypothetical protein [Verrucomicrobiae bacterium]